MKYIKTYEQLNINDKVSLYKNQLISDYNKKIEECMFYLTDEYDVINMSTGTGIVAIQSEYKSYYSFEYPEDIDCFVKQLKMCCESLILELNANIMIWCIGETQNNFKFSDFDLFTNYVTDQTNKPVIRVIKIVIS